MCRLCRRAGSPTNVCAVFGFAASNGYRRVVWVGKTSSGKLLLYDAYSQSGVSSKNYVRLFNVASGTEEEYRKSTLRPRIRRASKKESARAIGIYARIRHKAFMLRLGISKYPGTRESTKVRTAECYRCKGGLDSVSDIECLACGWLVCACGACGCGYGFTGYVRVT